jgi:TonB family protein
VYPQTTDDARVNHIEGTVLFQIVVDQNGHPTHITLLSPLGFGLDEKARAAVEAWEFAPGMKDGKPVDVLAMVDVNFRFRDTVRNEADRRRDSFNTAFESLKRADANAAVINRAVETMQDLSRQEFPAAMYVVGVWETSGEHVKGDSADGLALIQKAAAARYGPAVYEIATRRMEGRGLPRDVEKGLDEMGQAALLGSRQAQKDLGDRYLKGDGVPREPDRARWYFRLCAASGVALCQCRLGSWLLDAPSRTEYQYVQGIAWLELASEHGVAEAQDILFRERAALTPTENGLANGLKAALVKAQLQRKQGLSGW